MTRSEFESAVKDALRHYTQADLLARNALLHARLITHNTAGTATPPVLRALLVETAKTLFAGERDQRLYRVLDLTYFNPAPKQEAAAERLSLSFSTTGVAARGLEARPTGRWQAPDGSDRQAFLLSWRQTAAHCSVPIDYVA